MLDRTEVILEIFAQRAQTSRGQSCRSSWRGSSTCRRAWCAAGRTWSASAAASAATGGPGEKQLELDRRYIAQRVKTLKAKLIQLQKQRQVQRRARARGDVLSVAIVGYTNAGKSTLFNALAHAERLRGRPAVRHARHHHAPRLDRRRRQCHRRPTRSASSASCRTTWSRPSAPRSRRRCTPTCCCTWSTRPRRCATRRRRR